jgi:methionyl-tRNA formyltransferase
MDLVFCGTPVFAVPTLRRLVDEGFRVRLVVTQPDRPSGRGQQVAAPPVKRAAEDLGLAIVQPDKIKNNVEFRARLEALRPDAIVVVGYGRIIPKWMLDLPRLGNINLHGSLLPKYRGAAPIQWAIARGETVTGVTTMLLNEGLDTGDILMMREERIAPEDTAATLAARLAAIGAELMVETLRGLGAGTITRTPQDDSQATLAPILTREDGRIDFARPAPEIVNRWRGFQPWPGAFTTFRDRIVTVRSLRVAQERAPAPGAVNVRDHRLLVGCGDGTAVELLEVQLEGKKAVSARDFINGTRPQEGEVLGAASASQV